jgi:single-strand DNA-binding protein
MAGDTQITVVGNLVDDPELRFTPSGAAVANFRIASTPRTFDRQLGLNESVLRTKVMRPSAH